MLVDYLAVGMHCIPMMLDCLTECMDLQYDGSLLGLGGILTPLMFGNLCIPLPNL